MNCFTNLENKTLPFVKKKKTMSPVEKDQA